MENFLLDKEQKQVLTFNNGTAMVLAAPGCGKTQLLADRILYARNNKIPFSNMLCLTFTNRASREMKKRINESVNDEEGLSELFVGNLHRFCIRFLFANSIVPLNTIVIDEIDQEEIITELGKGEINKQWQINAIQKYSYYLFAREANLPSEICRMYENYENYNITSISIAEEYNRYKREAQLIDFDDILLYTYKVLCEDNYQKKYRFSSYDWIEVDEVQDLNPLHFSIIEKLRSNNLQPTTVYFGDEKQAIFSFIGAKKNSIQELIKKSDHTIYLLNNYRSSANLLTLLNDYATNELGVDSKQLPKSTNSLHMDDALISVNCNIVEQYQVLSMLARVLSDNSEDKTAILVSTNAEVEAMSAELDECKIPHMRLEKKDMFKGIPFKTIYGHFCVVVSEARYRDWTRLLYATKCVDKKSYAQRFVKKMQELCLTPHDLMIYDNSSYFIEFARSYSNKEIVIFDTETTGLNIFTDDIIQIAAIKVKNGSIVPCSEFNIIIETEKEIPAYLGDGNLNPMVEFYKNMEHVSAQDGFRMFIDYVGNDEVLGHNVDFDINIFKNNLLRRTQGLQFNPKQIWDSLKTARLIEPKLRSYKLKDLLLRYSIEGENSHNAMDDIIATANLVRYFYPIIQSKRKQQIDFIKQDDIQKIKANLVKNYRPYYIHTKQKLYSNVINEENTFEFELQYLYDEFSSRKFIDKIPLFHYMKQLFTKVVINAGVDQYFYQQLVNHLYEYRTFSESDLFDNKIIDEKVCVMTVHKAKGLEFDNVLLYNISDGVYPNYYFDDTEEKLLERKKVLYVAMSRAKKRLYYTYCYDKSPFLSKDYILKHFEELSQHKKNILIQKFTK